MTKPLIYAVLLVALVVAGVGCKTTAPTATVPENPVSDLEGQLGFPVTILGKWASSPSHAHLGGSQYVYRNEYVLGIDQRDGVLRYDYKAVATADTLLAESRGLLIFLRAVEITQGRKYTLYEFMFVQEYPPTVAGWLDMKYVSIEIVNRHNIEIGGTRYNRVSREGS